MGISLLHSHPPTGQGPVIRPSWAVFSQALGLGIYSLPKLVTPVGPKTDLGEDQTGPPVLSTIVRQGPVNAGLHSAGGVRIKPILPGQA